MKNWSHFKLGESQAPMPYSISNVGAIWLSHLQIKTLFVIFISGNKLDSVHDCCRKRSHFRCLVTQNLSSWLEESQMIASYSISHVRHQFGSLFMNHARFGPHCLPNHHVLLGFILLKHCTIRGRANSPWALCSSFLQSRAISATRYEVYFIDQSAYCLDSCCAAKIQSTPLLAKKVSGISS